MKTGTTDTRAAPAALVCGAALICLLLWSIPVMAQDDSRGPDKLIVGIFNFPPYAMQAPTGEWVGLSMDLLKLAARDLGAEIDLREYDSLDQIKAAVARGELDLVPVASITKSLEDILDFSNPYYSSGSAIAVALKAENPMLLRHAGRFFSVGLLKVLGLLLWLWITAGTLVWLFERRPNADMFGARAARGIGHGIWWAAVTMTTVGYGDKAPRSFGGRVVAIVWMFASIILISGFTATITTTLTIGELGGKVRGFHDLPGVRVGSLAQSLVSDYLAENGVAAEPFSSLQAGLQALSENNIDAFVHDIAILKYLVKTGYRNQVKILPGKFNHYYVSMALPPDSRLREPLNRALLKIMMGKKWEKVLLRYFGSNRT